VSDIALWRVHALATPPLAAPCARCARLQRFECAGRFRVNAQQRRLDVWLLYRCSVCGATAKRRLARRRSVDEIPRERLEAYLRNDPALVRAHAFELPLAGALPYRVERPPLGAARALRVRIAQPHPCGVRWDRFLARELGWTRSRAARAWRSAAVCVRPRGSPARAVADGDEVSVSW
jgi:hypothetical protein